MNFEIKILELGNVLPESSRRVQNFNVGQKSWSVVLSYLLLGPEPVLVDTGFRDTEILKTLGMHATQTKEQGLERQRRFTG